MKTILLALAATGLGLSQASSVPVAPAYEAGRCFGWENEDAADMARRLSDREVIDGHVGWVYVRVVGRSCEFLADRDYTVMRASFLDRHEGGYETVLRLGETNVPGVYAGYRHHAVLGISPGLYGYVHGY